MKANSDAEIYRKQMIKFAEESKKQITIMGDVIESVSDDAELGKLVRDMYVFFRNEADERIEYLKNQK